MASIINSISFKNFYNYYGDYDDNCYELKPHLNIIVADNGAGKSKFFNAFLWLFYDQVLDSDDKVKKAIKDTWLKVVSDKAKFECEINETIECGIRIEYTQGTRYKYRITKSFQVSRLGDSITEKGDWHFVHADLQVDRSELVLHRYRPIYDEDEKRNIINYLITPVFRRYSFLQGEEMDKIIDFSEKSSIVDAVHHLTDINLYSKLVTVSEDIEKKARNSLEQRNNANDAQAKLFKEAVQSLEKKQIELKRLEEQLSQMESTFAEAEKEKTELDKQYANAEQSKELSDKLKEANKSLRSAEIQYKEHLDNINDKLFDGRTAWVATGFNSLLESFQDKFNKYNKERYEKEASMEAGGENNESLTVLPVDSPDAVTLKTMIDDEFCYVCNRVAPRGSSEHNHFIKLQNRSKSDDKRVESVKNDLRRFFGDIQMNAQPYYTKVDQIEDSIRRFKEREMQLVKSVDRCKEAVKSLKSQKSDLIVVSDNQDDSYNDIINGYKGAIKRMESSRAKIDDIIKPKISSLKSEIRRIESDIESNTSVDTPKGFKDNYAIAKDIAEATRKAKDRVFDEMILLLEGHANRHFQDLIKNNDLAGGILKFNKTPAGGISFDYIDSRGNTVYGSSEGFQRMKKFSVVMAIITANKSQYNYPLLGDAPISAFGSGFSEGFFECTAKVFPQSIILVKDLYDKEDDMKLTELGKRLLSQEEVSTFYLNEVPEDCEQIELVTTSKKYK